MMKNRKHMITLVCLVVGMLVLSTAVYANYDNASGYSNYKDALKYLAFNTDNVTLGADMQMIVDGKTVMDTEGLAKYEGAKSSTYSRNAIGDGTGEESYNYDDGKNYVLYDPADNTYRSWESSGYYNGNLLGVDMDDATERKAIRFTELLADTLVGDIKNNVALIGNENGAKEYQLHLSQSQIPEVVNAGLSFLFTSYNAGSLNDSDYVPSYVTYENYNAAFAAWYQEKTGSELTEEQYEAYMNGSWDDEMVEMDEEFYGYYEDVLEERGDVGIIYVAEDATYTYYPTEEEYALEVHGGDLGSITESDLMANMGNDPYIESAICRFTLDEQGRLIGNYLEATLTGVDEEGQSHYATMKIDLRATDYGTTEADVFDPAGKEEIAHYY